MTDFLVGRLVSGPKMLEIVDLRPASTSDILLSWFEILVSGLGIPRSSATEVSPAPCFDIDELHRRNSAKIISQRKG